MYTVSDCEKTYYVGDSLEEAKAEAEKFNADIFDANGEIVEG